MGHRISEDWNTVSEDTIYSVPKAVLKRGDATRAFNAHGWSPETAVGRPLAVYVHVPFCVSLCQFCGFVTTGKFSHADLEIYEHSVIRELALATEKTGCGGRKLGAVFFGGGTASVLSPGAVSNIFASIKECFQLEPQAELTFEGECQTLKRPRYLQEIAELGFQRLSFGVQTMDRGIRELVNLVPSPELMAQVCASARKMFDEVSVDFIFGWPAQDVDHMKSDLIQLIETLDPDGIETFRFEGADAAPAIMELFNSLNCVVPNGETFFELQQVLHKTLTQYGYQRVSYTKYSRVSKPYSGSYGECYYGWGEGEVLGIGRGAQSFLDGAMFGTAHSQIHYNALIEDGRVPVADFATYLPGQRENITWPRRGWIERCDITSSFEWVVDEIQRAGLAEENASRIKLTPAGEVRVPLLLDMLWRQVESGGPVRAMTA